MINLVIRLKQREKDHDGKVERIKKIISVKKNLALVCYVD